VMNGDPRRAARLLGAAENLRQSSRTVMLGPEQVDYDRHLEQLRSALDGAELEREWAVGRSMVLDDAIDLAVGG
jgi:hypothetical protein